MAGEGGWEVWQTAIQRDSAGRGRGGEEIYM